MVMLRMLCIGDIQFHPFLSISYPNDKEYPISPVYSHLIADSTFGKAVARRRDAHISESRYGAPGVREKAERRIVVAGLAGGARKEAIQSFRAWALIHQERITEFTEGKTDHRGRRGAF
jgi:hypothetical protein